MNWDEVQTSVCIIYIVFNMVEKAEISAKIILNKYLGLSFFNQN